eukprot:538959-Amphidinium_carterae.2
MTSTSEWHDWQAGPIDNSVVLTSGGARQFPETGISAIYSRTASRVTSTSELHEWQAWPSSLRVMGNLRASWEL